MPFSDRFQLIGPKRDEAVRTFEAREIATGRPVFVHFFTEPNSPINRALLAKMDALPEEERRRVLDRGEHEGGIYLVTDRLAEYDGLLEWLSQKKSGKPPTLDVGGAWRIPPPSPRPVEADAPKFFETAPQSPVEPAILNEHPPVPKLTDTGEHTLELPPKPSAVPKPQAPSPKSPGQSLEPGEFTKLFATPVIRPPDAPANPPQANASPVSPPPAPVPQPQLPAKEPGEFTRLFASPVQRPAPAPKSGEPGEFTRQLVPPVQRPTPPPAPAHEPGEFTRLMSTPVQRPTPVRTPAPAAHEPGEFTRMMATPLPSAAAPPKPAERPGEFTSLFQATQRPAPAPPNPATDIPPPQPGEFTALLRAQTPPAAKRPDSGEFSSLFESPMASSSPAPQLQPAAPLVPPRPSSQPRDVGEFTQIFGKGDGPTPAPAPAPAAPPSLATSNATQVFSVPRPAIHPGPALPPQGPGEVTQMFAKAAPLTFGQAPPPAPVARAPEPVRPAGNSSMLPIILLIGGGALLLFALVVYLLMRH